MAPVINIPVSFEFRAMKVTWTHTTARIIGWWKHDDGRIDTDNLIAEVPVDGSTKTYRFPLGHLPPQEWERVIELAIDSDEDEHLERICSAFRPQVLVPSSTGDYVPRGDWGKNSRPADPWQMRNDFLQISGNNESVLDFLNKWGHSNLVRLVDLLRLQKAVREALTSSPEKWFASPQSYPPVWRHRPTYPYFTLQTVECTTAICMTVTIDLLRRVKFKICARHDCGLPYPVQSKHKRKYCSQYCGHLESMRRNRKQRAS
jgi:hypothetical protein